MNEKKQPDVFKKDERGQEVFDFVKKITLGAGLNTEYKWKGNEVVIRQS
jgi:hypothetical protein